MRIYFFAPDSDSEHVDRRDQRVQVLDHDEVTRSHRVVFPDGYRLVVSESELCSREVVA